MNMFGERGIIMQVINTGNVPDKKLITVVLRSHINPSPNLEGFSIGKKMQVKLPYDMCLDEFLKTFFHENLNEIGLIAINSRMVNSRRTLSEGDFIDIFSRIAGG